MCSILLIPPASDNQITTPNIHTVQGPQGREGHDGIPGRDGRDGASGDKEKREIMVCRDQLAHNVCTLNLNYI